jgi:hypothetical protein
MIVLKHDSNNLEKHVYFGNNQKKIGAHNLAIHTPSLASAFIMPSLFIQAIAESVQVRKIRQKVLI